MNTILNKISCSNSNEFRVTFDKICDFIPVVSTISMTIGAIQKHLYVPEMEANGSLTNHHYYKHLKEKDFEQKWLLFIPGFNFFFAIVAYCALDTSKGVNEYSQSQIFGEITNNREDSSEIDEKKEDEELTLNEENRKADKEKKILEASIQFELLYPGININGIIQKNPYRENSDFINRLYEELLESSCFCLSSIQMKRSIEAFNLCVIPTRSENIFYEDISKAFAPIFQIVKLLTPKSCDRIFNVISNLPNEYKIQNLINAANFFLISSRPHIDPTLPLCILEEISKLPHKISNILIFTEGNWNNLVLLSDFIHSRNTSSNNEMSISNFNKYYIDSREESTNEVLTTINKALEQFENVGAKEVSAIIQIVCHLTTEKSDMLFKLISSLKPICQNKNIINAALFIHSKDDFNLTLSILQKVYDSPNGYNFLFDKQNWNSLGAIYNLAQRFPDQREEIVNKLIEFDSQKIQNYKSISFKPDDSSKIEEIDIVKIIIWSDIFMKNEFPPFDSRKKFSFSQYNSNLAKADSKAKDLKLEDVIKKLVNIPQVQYRIFNETFLETIQRSELIVKERLEILDKALLDDMIMQKSILLFSANNHTFSYSECNAENIAFIQVMQLTFLPIFLEVMKKK